MLVDKRVDVYDVSFETSFKCRLIIVGSRISGTRVAFSCVVIHGNTPRGLAVDFFSNNKIIQIVNRFRRAAAFQTKYNAASM